MIPPTPSTRRVAPIKSGATAWTLRSKKARVMGGFLSRVAARASTEFGAANRLVEAKADSFAGF